VELSLNTATVRKQWNLAQIIDGCARHQIRGISPWRDQVAALGLSKTVSLLKRHDLTVTGLCRGGFFTAKDWRDDNLRAIEEAHELGAQCLVLVVGGLLPGSRICCPRERVQDCIARSCPRRARPGCRSRSSRCIRCRPRARVRQYARAGARYLRRAGEGIGVAVRRLPRVVGPEAEQQIARAEKKRLLAYHICDWLVPTRDLVSDRGMMGDGVIDLPSIRAGSRRGLRRLPGGGDLLRARLVEARS
jgi:sugar phosphate isomerase/epimerase